MGRIRRILSKDQYGHPIIAKVQDDGYERSVFISWGPNKTLDPLQVLARGVITGILTDPSLGTIAQVFDSLQPSPRVDEFKGHLLRELRWAQRLLNDAIKHLDPKSKTPESESKE